MAFAENWITSFIGIQITYLLNQHNLWAKKKKKSFRIYILLLRGIEKYMFLEMKVQSA